MLEISRFAHHIVPIVTKVTIIPKNAKRAESPLPVACRFRTINLSDFYKRPIFSSRITLNAISTSFRVSFPIFV